MVMKTTKKISLPESEIPKQWYNILADMPQQPQPLLNPATRRPLKKEEMYGLFAKELVKQEFTKEKFVDIPNEVRLYTRYTAQLRWLGQAVWRRLSIPLQRSILRMRV